MEVGIVDGGRGGWCKDRGVDGRGVGGGRVAQWKICFQTSLLVLSAEFYTYIMAMGSMYMIY